ncbi:Crp/Fnr family transcriptional regulator [uncultured Hymenobacter sp.]|uniref:Crp/Fnr family transcriptional regulator n=1 Tax=uncultured Hymenobacter sp. TaxID=170016 RepID=UPI0035C9CEBD
MTLPAQEALQQIAKRRSLPRGALLLEEGEVSDKIFFVERGLVRAFYNEDSREITSWLSDEGQALCSLPCSFLGRPARETMQLLEPTTVLMLERADLEAVKRSYKSLADVEYRLMERYLLLFMARIRLLQIPKAKERQEVFSQEQSEFYRRVPLSYIATYLGIDPATLSRLRARF